MLHPETPSGVRKRERSASSLAARLVLAALVLTAFAVLAYYRLAPPMTLRVALVAVLGASFYLPALVEYDARHSLWLALFVTPAAYVSFVVFAPGQPLALIAGASCVASGLLLWFRSFVPERTRLVRRLTLIGYLFAVVGLSTYYALLAVIFVAAELIA